MTNQAQLYAKELLKLIIRYSDNKQLFRVTSILEREANLICKESPAMSDAKTHLVTKTLFGGKHG